MKNTLLISGLIATISIPVHAADYQSFITPSSLGKSINTLNKKYQLGLKKQSSGKYANHRLNGCSLLVKTDKKNRINEIKIIDNKDCRYTTTSNVNYNSQTTKTQDLLSQVDIQDVQFVPGCFNCPSRLEITDTLVIDREKDNYHTKFEIKGHNRKYLNYIAKNLFGDFSDENYYSIMDMLESRAAKDPTLYDRNEFKLQAIEAYNLQDKPQSYTIALN
ncbi:hypothetical protein [uncultured Psychrobacter sp.]|uniref:hypothetical protein n=1 Tax=uncultured Psychrobacter sp. TaxID=259303 RepID=UPI00261BFB9F|nr:hypothetical protein [uncultured Psychrobacter sp.]